MPRIQNTTQSRPLSFTKTRLRSNIMPQPLHRLMLSTLLKLVVPPRPLLMLKLFLPPNLVLLLLMEVPGPPFLWQPLVLSKHTKQRLPKLLLIKHMHRLVELMDAQVIYQPHQCQVKLIVKQHVQEKEHGPQTLLQQPLNQVLQMVLLKLIPFTATVSIGKPLEPFVSLLLHTQ